jgi:hypothetical protein
VIPSANDDTDVVTHIIGLHPEMAFFGSGQARIDKLPFLDRHYFFP